MGNDDEIDLFMDSFDADLVQMPGDKTMVKTPNDNNRPISKVHNIKVDDKNTKTKSTVSKQQIGFMSAKKLYEERLEIQNKIEKEKVKLNLNNQITNSSNVIKNESSKRDNVSKKKENSGEKRKNEEMKEAKKIKITTEQINKEEKVQENNNIDGKENIPIKHLNKNVIVKVKPKVSEDDPSLELARWGLPDSILTGYADKGIKKMFPWQVECLRSAGVMEGKNLVYSAPTSAGKSLVAEILMIKRVIESGRKALLILPFVSLAREKMFHLQHVLGETGIRVEGFMGSISPQGGIKVADIGVATIEKANGIVNRLLEEGELDKIGCIVIDELHMLGDPSRGYLLELLLTKVRYVSLGYEDPEKSVQIVGMSATLPNLTDLSDWLDASLYTTDFRPVPLTELVKIGRTLYNTALDPVGHVVPEVQIPEDVENMSWLSLQTILAGHSILIFCPIKSWVENLAVGVAKDLFFIGKPDPQDKDPVTCDIRSRLQQELDGFKLSEVLEQLKRCPSGLDNTLANTLRFGVGFHHAGLTTDERDILEGNFKSGVIRVLVATSTLSSGVNLPARRVILRCPMTYNGQLMEKLAYKQMVGRAGRKGVDTAGESILICKESEKAKVRELVSGETEPVYSCLAAGGNKLAASMKRAILEVVVSGAASTRQQVERYASCTLLAAQIKKEGENSILECIDFLEKNEFIRIQPEEGTDILRYVPSRLGMACLSSSLAPDEEGYLCMQELAKARKQFVLENELHIIYLIVPIYAAVSWPKLDWMNFLSMFEGLSEDMKRVGQIIGVEERWMVRAMRGTIRTSDPSQRNILAAHQRFYTALALHDLAHEVPLSTVASKFGATKGMLQSLQQAASTFAGMVTVFCSRLGWSNIELLLGQFQDRLEFGVRRELIDLCRLASVDGARARVLFNGGIETVAQLASSKSEQIENILYSAEPFKSKKNNEANGEDNKKVKTVFISGLPPMTEADAAKLMVAEARSVLQRDLGLHAGAWSQSQKHELQKITTTPTSNPSDKKKKLSYSSGKKSSYNRRKSSSESKPPDASPHLAYHMTAATNGQQLKPLDLNTLVNSSFQNSPDFKTPEPTQKPKSIIGNKDIFISPPEHQRIKRTEVTEDKTEKENTEQAEQEEIKGEKENQFDMSCIMDSIFENEVEMVEESEEISASPVLKKIKEDKKNNNERSDTKPYIHCEELTLELSETDESMDDITPGQARDKSAGSKTIAANHQVPTLISADTIAAWDDDLFESSNIDDDSSVKNKNDDFTNDSNDMNKLNVFNSPGTPLTYSRMKMSLKERKKQAKSIKKVTNSPGDMILSDSDDGTPKDDKKRRSASFKDIHEETDKILDITNDVDSKVTTLDNTDQDLIIVDVCCDKKIFQSFTEEFKTVQSYSFAVAVESINENDRDENCVLSIDNGVISGVGFCFSDKMQCFYVCLRDFQDKELNISCRNPDLDKRIRFDDKIKFLSWIVGSQIPGCAISWRRQHHFLYKLTGQFPCGTGADPAVASWILEPGAPPLTLNRMVLENIPDLSKLVGRLGSSPGVGSVATCPFTSIPGRIRAAAECVMVFQLVYKYRQDLAEKDLEENFLKVEMGVEHVLLGMELTGMGIHAQEYRDTKLLLEQRCKLIEEEAYKLAGRHFTFSSPQDVIRVLYHEMRFPVNGDPKLTLKMVRPGKGGIKLSATKDILEKLARNHDLPKLILEHRRISGALTRTVNPLLTSDSILPNQTLGRVYTSCVTHTATGRVTLQEPNLQNIPKDFEVEMTDDLRQKALGRRSKRRSNSSNRSLLALSSHLEKLLEPSQSSSTISLRNALVPGEGNLYLSADYSQLELRILAHFSQDSILMDTLKIVGGDVFKGLAARINKIEVNEVTDEQRQQAKQIVYGIIYGVGAKTLAEQLSLTEQEAEKFMDSFKAKYPGVRIFLNKCVASARRTGYVESLAGRCRSIPDIQATNMHRRAAAERQAVNTKVQGSAADLVKLAMIDIDQEINKIWPNRRPLKSNNKNSKRSMKGPWLALQLHDELIYEVPTDDIMKMAAIVRSCMEGAITLSVPTPVRIKIGDTWGNLKVFHFPGEK